MLACLLALSVWPAIASADPSSPDTSFGSAGSTHVWSGAMCGGPGGCDWLDLISVVYPGNMIASCGRVSGAFNAFLVGSDGKVVRTFGRNGLAQLPFAKSSQCGKLFVAPDGGLVISGSDYDHHEFVVTHLSANGVLDASFGTKGVVHIPFKGTNGEQVSTLSLIHI